MSSYLPKDSSGSPYAEGGGLFAIGLIHANHGSGIMDYLTQELQRANLNEVRCYHTPTSLSTPSLSSLYSLFLYFPFLPLCRSFVMVVVLGLAWQPWAQLMLVSVLSSSFVPSPTPYYSDTYNLLKDNLFQDDAVIGEAAGVAMGLVMLGQPSVVKEMIDVR